MVTGLGIDLVPFLGASLRSPAVLAAESLFLPKQFSHIPGTTGKAPARFRCNARAVTSSWGEERIAAELLLKIGLRVSPRTVHRHMARGVGWRGRGAAGQRWATFVRNHAHALVACDFCVAVTETFRLLYVFVTCPGDWSTPKLVSDPLCASMRRSGSRVCPIGG